MTGQQHDHNRITPGNSTGIRGTKVYRPDPVSRFLKWLDALPLQFLVFPLLAVALSYYLLLGKNCVFEINDQLDETLFTYVLNAKYLFTPGTTFPELLGGVPRSGMMVSAWIFVPLYRIFPTFTAFMLQFAIVMATAYLGMYAAVKELGGSSLIAFLCGTMFLFLPYQPVYGLSIVGGPMILYAFVCLYRRKHLLRSALLIVYFTLGAHLVLLGYVALGFAALAGILLLIRIIRRKMTWQQTRPFYLGLFGMLVLYCVINRELFLELILGNGGFVSHREEMVISGTGFASAWEVFWHSAQHAVSLHQYLVVPIVFLIVLYGLRYRRLDDRLQKIYRMVVLLFVINVLTALFYGICESAPVIAWRNSVSGFFHYFSANRVYWIFPTTWYLAAGLAMHLILGYHSAAHSAAAVTQAPAQWEGDRYSLLGTWPSLVSFLLIGVLLLPTAWNVRQNSNWILNKSQYKNHCNVGLMSWSDYFAEDVMAQIRDYIGQDQSAYKVASLGMCPATALEAGFYCIDGYSNSYSLDYKHAFRKIIARELAACPPMAAYFDGWGSRCYLLTRESQNYYYLKKGADFSYEKLQLDTEQMKKLGCTYLFAAAEIKDADSMHLQLEKTFSTENSYYEVWLYRLQ